MIFFKNSFRNKGLSKKLDSEHAQRGTCIKGLKWPPIEQKTEICFSQISLDLFIRRMAEV